MYLGVLRVLGKNHPSVTDAVLTGVARGLLAGDSLDYLIRAPTFLATHYIFRAVHNIVRLAHTGPRLAVAFSGLGEVLLTSEDGSVTIAAVPVRQRRGTPEDPERAWSEEVLYRQPRFAAHRLASGLMAMAWFTDGRLALVYTDLDPGDGNFSLEAAWLTLIAPGRNLACVDIPIPVSGTGLPSFTFQGDTLAVLDQLLQEDRIRLRVRRMQVDLTRCEWLPMLPAATQWEPGPI